MSSWHRTIEIAERPKDLVRKLMVQKRAVADLLNQVPGEVGASVGPKITTKSPPEERRKYLG